MNPDDELCVCFHVSCRKLANWIRIHRPRRAGELSQCFGAGTGCGWCRPWLEQLFAASQATPGITPAGSPSGLRAAADAANHSAVDEMAARMPDAADYGQNRLAWRRAKDAPDSSARPLSEPLRADPCDPPEAGHGH